MKEYARAEAVLGLPREELLKRTCDDPQWRNSTPDGAPWPEDERPFRRIILNWLSCEVWIFRC